MQAKKDANRRPSQRRPRPLPQPPRARIENEPRRRYWRPWPMRDLDARQLLAQEGFSLISDRPYRGLFQVSDVSLVDASVVLRLQPLGEGGDRRVGTILQMFYQRDMFFAACSLD